MFKRRESDFADFQPICGIAVVLLILLFLDTKVQNALHRGRVVAWGSDALTGAELGEGFVLLTAERLQTTKQCIWKGIEGDSHGDLAFLAYSEAVDNLFE